MTRVVRFVQGWSPYQAGEVAGFEDALAERLVASGVAVPYPGADSRAPVHGAIEQPPAHRAMRSPRRKRK